MVPGVLTIENFPPGYWNQLSFISNGFIFIKSNTIIYQKEWSIEIDNRYGCKFAFYFTPIQLGYSLIGVEFGNIICSFPGSNINIHII